MYQKIMVPLDGSDLAECVLPHVEAFTSRCQILTIVFVRVVKPMTAAFSGDYPIGVVNLQKQEQILKDAANEYLKNVAARIKRGEADLKTEVLLGPPADKLVEYVEENGIDLILMATHGRSGVSRWVWGSVVDRILRAASIPVLMVRAPGVTGKQI